MSVISENDERRDAVLGVDWLGPTVTSANSDILPSLQDEVFQNAGPVGGMGGRGDSDVGMS
jgi:hypothetical protein